MNTPTVGRPFDPKGVMEIVHELASKGMKAPAIHEELKKRGKAVGLSTIYIYLRTPIEAANQSPAT